jgi:hypothetical protein
LRCRSAVGRARDRQGRKVFLRFLQSHKKWGDIVRTVATRDEIFTIAPHFMALATVDAMAEEGMAPASAPREYDRAGVEAVKKLRVPFAFATDEWFAWMKAALNRWEETKPEP